MGPEKLKKEVAQNPTNTDVHEQRDAAQTREGVVPSSTRGPAQSEVDQQRADWEGMAPPPPTTRK
jgi:hypothetical protein